MMFHGCSMEERSSRSYARANVSRSSSRLSTTTGILHHSHDARGCSHRCLLRSRHGGPSSPYPSSTRTQDRCYVPNRQHVQGYGENPLAIEDVLNPPAAAARRRFEIPVLVAALLVVPVIFIEEQATSQAWLNIAAGVNWLIWAAFAAEYLVVLALADRRWAYTRKAWLDVFIIVSSFPLLPGLLASTRLFRLLRLGRVLRLLRLFRLAAVVTPTHRGYWPGEYPSSRSLPG